LQAHHSSHLLLLLLLLLLQEVRHQIGKKLLMMKMYVKSLRGV